MILFVVMSCFIHAKEILLGTSAAGLLGIVMWAIFSKNSQIVQKRIEYPYGVVALIALAGFYFIWMLPQVVILFFTFIVPLTISFVHASFRLRNLSAKVNIKMENLRFKQTVRTLIYC
jgi:hypothetical protein